MFEIEADTDQISGAAGRLQGVSSSLADGGYRGIDPGVLGFPVAQSAMANFLAAWTAGTQCLSEGVGKLGQAVSQSASNYDGAETHNIGGMRAR